MEMWIMPRVAGHRRLRCSTGGAELNPSGGEFVGEAVGDGKPLGW